MEEAVDIKVSGHVKIWEMETDKVLYDDHNALTANAPNIIRRALGSGNNIDEITALKASVVLATVPVTSIIYSAPAINEVTFRAVFNQVSFNDTLDELQLGESTHGLFSAVTGLSIFKDNNTQIGVEWKLKITT